MTQNKIIKEIKEIISNHPMLGSDRYHIGDPADLAKLNMNYSYVIIQPIPYSLSEQVINLTYRFFIFDIVDESLINLQDVHSDSISLAFDLINKISYTTRDYFISYETTINLFNEKFDDVNAGLFFDLSFSIPRLNDICSIPNNN